MELQILHWFESLQNTVTNPIMYGFTLLGEFGAIWILLAVVMLFFLPKRYRKVGLTVAIALLISLIMCNGVMKNLVQRIRPFVADPTLGNLYNVQSLITDWSFPSGHTSASFSAAIAVIMWRKKEGIAALVLALLISVSRLYLTVHYPTDVLVSMVLGSLYGLIAYFIVKFLMKKSPKFRTIFQ